MAGHSFDPDRFLSHAAHVRELARRLVFDADLALEVEQETWLAALRHGTEGVREPRAWLSRVARHAAQRLGAKRLRRQDVEAVCASDEGTGPSDFDLAERERALKAVLRAVARLPEAVRTTIVMHHLDGLTLREVARRQETPLETVRSRAKRGLQLLREDLAQGEPRSSGWALALVGALDLSPPVAPLSVQPLAWMMSMSTALKSGLAAVAVFVLVAAGRLGLEGQDPVPVDVRSAPVAAAEILTVGGTAQRSTVVANLAEVESRPSDPSVPDALIPSEGASGGLSVEVVWSESGALAGGVPVWIDRQDGTKRSSPARLTSTAGQLLCESLPPGPYALQTAFGGMRFVEVAPDVLTEVRLEIPVGQRVQGRVVDPAGSPVSGAEIFLWPGGLRAQFEGAVIAHSDEDGEFELPSVSVQANGCLSARAARRSPTPQVMLTGSSGSEVEVELRFEQPGRTLAGRVLDNDGRPVAGAEVLVGVERDVLMQRLPDGRFGYPAIGQLVQTDDQGRFDLLGAPFDTLALQVRSAGYAPWRGEWIADGPGWMDVRLEPGARVFGHVRTANGGVVENALIRTGNTIAFASGYTKSAADGSYSLASLASGRIEIMVETGQGDRARSALELGVGEERRWDPVPGGGLELEGRIDASAIDSPERFAGRWMVRGIGPFRRGGGRRYLETARVDEAGRFRLRQLPEGEAVDVTLGVIGSSFWLARASGVVPGGEPLVLRPEPERLPTSSLRGALVDEDGEPVTTADVWVRHPRFGGTLVHPQPDGSFEHGGLPAGEWTLEVDPLTADWSILRTTVTVGVDEVVDTGSLRLGEGGFAAISIADPWPVESADGLRFELRDVAGRTVSWLRFESGTARSLPLIPGEYSLAFEDPSAFEPTPRFVVNAGLETVVEVRRAAGTLPD